MTIHKNILIRQVQTGSTATETFIYREYIQLGGGHKYIRGVMVDCGNSPLPVYIWQGRSPNLGVSTIILPGWSRGFSVSGTSAIYVVITGIINPITLTGQVVLTVSDEEITAFANQVVIANPPPIPPITIPGGGVPVI